MGFAKQRVWTSGLANGVQVASVTLARSRANHEKMTLVMMSVASALQTLLWTQGVAKWHK